MIPWFIRILMMGLSLLATFSTALAVEVQLNATGGTTASNGLRTLIDDTTQIQVRRLNNTGQLYNPVSIPPSNQLDNGIYLRANNVMYGPSHFAFLAAGYVNRTLSAPTPSTLSLGVTQVTSASFNTPNIINTSRNVAVSLNWKYTFPLDFITLEVTLTIPNGYPVSANNPVRYYHVVDTYLGGNDNGCGVRYTDTNGRQVIGTYPLTSGICPSSNALPANLDVIESFRERNGKFDHYCVGFWNDFWSQGLLFPPSCSISRASGLGDTISTVYQDTGAAIEFDFTSAGTYTFSYDFVVGSTFVPNYDHLEIRHPGTGTLCPVDMQVLACLSSTVPCPDNQLVATGSLTGSLTFSPSSPAVSESPQLFDIGSVGPIATVSAQASAAGTFTIGATGLSKTPLSGVRCWNTATSSASCSFTFTNTPCVSTFECMENGLSYNNLSTTPSARNPLYTKVLGTAFDVDVVALLANGTQSSGYNSALGLTVNLVTEDAGSCGATVVASKQVSFAAADNGRKKVTFAGTDVLRAYPNLRCRVTDTSLQKTGCSSDNFAIRPAALSVTSSNATQVSPASNSLPVFKAGTDNFSLAASSGEVGYNGLPKIDNTRLQGHTGAVAVGQVTGAFAAANAGVSAGSSFKYSEVGHFRFSSQGVFDDTFTAVDSSKGDCDNAVSPFDNVGSGNPKRYGCRFGNTADSSYFGRFIPDRFSIVANTGGVTQACTSFVYYGQDSTTTPGLVTPFTLLAQNAAGVTTQNYTGSYARFDLSVWSNYQFTASPLNGATLSASAVSPAVTGTWNNGQANVTARHRLSRPAAPVSPANVIISARPQDTDSTVLIDSSQTALTGNVPYRYGRLAVTPAHGSELLPLRVPVETQYWNGSAYLRSLGDNCTTVPPASIVMRNYRGNLNACETQLSGSATMTNGVLNMNLSAPRIGSDGRPNVGSVDLEVNLGAATAGDKTCLSSAESTASGGSIPWLGSTDPSARASFGIYKAPVIYLRENF